MCSKGFLRTFTIKISHNLVSPAFFDDFLEIPLRSQSSASGALLLPASSVRLPAFSRPEFRSSSPKNWGSPAWLRALNGIAVENSSFPPSSLCAQSAFQGATHL
ncbi:MAG: hypothetical protein LUG16_00320, partial [Candidatus Gastranaerophilales bacterium]|nr:hypothetical protein [Candidatus Gastranaerophilales bacterium]